MEERMENNEMENNNNNMEEMNESEDRVEKVTERKLVIPGEVIVSGEDYLPGDLTRREGKDILASRYGLAEVSGRVVRIIPISGVFEPRRGNVVIGRVEDVTFNGWIIDIDGPYGAFLPLAECPRFINRNEYF